MIYIRMMIFLFSLLSVIFICTLFLLIFAIRIYTKKYDKSCVSKNIGVYGGSFNPIHNGHLQVAKDFLDCGGIDEIWFVPCTQNPLKTKKDVN